MCTDQKEEVMASIKRGKETFKGYNAPKRTPSHPTKSHAVLAKQGVQTKLIRFGQLAVLAKQGDQTKLIRFGQQGVSGSPKKVGESSAYKARRESFKARHADNIAKGKMSAAYWADKTKW